METRYSHGIWTKVVSVKKAPLSVSVLILLAGVIVFSWSNQLLETPENQPVNRRQELPYGSWRISTYCQEGEKLLVQFTRPQVGENPIVDDPKMLVNITDPHGGNTTFQVIFIIKELTGEARISLLDEGEGMIVENPEFEVGGVTVYDGNYTAYVYTEAQALAGMYYDDGVLPNLQLFKVIITREYPNRTFLPAGVGLLIAGLALLVWGAKSA